MTPSDLEIVRREHADMVRLAMLACDSAPTLQPLDKWLDSYVHRGRKLADCSLEEVLDVIAYGKSNWVNAIILRVHAT